jgi:hypothetical protein
MTQTRFAQQELFLAADAALREVVDQLSPADLGIAAPAAWTRQADPTLHDILAAHAKDEAWVPAVIAGTTIDEVGGLFDGDLLGEDPIGAYDRFNDEATAAASGELDPDAVAHLSYGDFPLSTYFEHVSYYRAFQAWSIAKLVDLPFSMSDELVEALWVSVEPQLDELRAIQVFGPEVEVPADSSRETHLLGKTGFWVP